jgi:hypothetical protein
MCFLFLFSCPTSLRNGSCISSFLDCFRALLAYPPDSMFAAEGSLSFIGTAMERGKHSCLAGRARICRDLTSDELRGLCSHTSRRCPMGFRHRRASTLARLLCPTGTPLADCFIRRPFEEPAYGSRTTSRTVTCEDLHVKIPRDTCRSFPLVTFERRRIKAISWLGLDADGFSTICDM